MIDASRIQDSITADSIEAGHISIGTINMKTGKQGVKHLYSDGYRERWPQDLYPELYKEDISCD